MTAINNLDILTDKIYQEGIEKAQKDSRDIISKAEADRDQMLEIANSEAKKIIINAEKEAVRITRSVEKELQLKGKQLVSDLKNEIQNVLSKKILNTNTKAAFADDKFLQSAILAAIASWKPTDDLELILPKELEKKLDSAFSKSISDHTTNLVITFNDRLTSGFRIAKKSDGYQISFSEDDFVALFAPYLNKQIDALLFNQST